MIYRKTDKHNPPSPSLTLREGNRTTLDTTFKRWYFDFVTVHRIYAATRTNQRRWAMPKPTEAALRKLRRKFLHAQTAGRVSGRARFGWKVVKAPGKVRPPYRLCPVDERTGKDVTPQVGGVGFTPQPRQKVKKVIRRASRAHVASLTLMQINQTLVACYYNQTHTAKSLGISPRTLTRVHLELLAQKAAEQHAAVPSPAPAPETTPPPASPSTPAPTAPDTEHNPVTGESLEPSTPPDLGPDSDEEPVPDAASNKTGNPDPLSHSSGGCDDKI